MARRYIYQGARFDVAFALENSGSCPGEAFLNDLSKPNQAKLMTLFRRLGDHGRISNPEKLGNLKDGLYEFKSHQIRMPFAYATKPETRLVIITHGFIKKSPKADDSEITRAWRIFKEDQAARTLGIVRKNKA